MRRHKQIMGKANLKDKALSGQRNFQFAFYALITYNWRENSKLDFLRFHKTSAV